MRESVSRERGPGLPGVPFRWLRVFCAVGVMAIGLACAPDSQPGIVLITVDTLRADALDLSPRDPGGEPGSTPALARLASEGTVFERAVAPMSLTRPAHFSIFTGRYPREHGVVNNQISLPESEATVAEHLQAAGYATAAFVAVNLLGPGSGAEQGFDVFEAPSSQLEWPASRVVAEAEGWLDGLAADQPFFLWVHLFDPHQPYDPPADLRASLEPELEARYPHSAGVNCSKSRAKGEG